MTARETALASRKNCVDQWMAWHTRLKAEEDRVIRMEQAAIKLVAATSSVLSQGNMMRFYIKRIFSSTLFQFFNEILIKRGSKSSVY